MILTLPEPLLRGRQKSRKHDFYTQVPHRHLRLGRTLRQHSLYTKKRHCWSRMICFKELDAPVTAEFPSARYYTRKTYTFVLNQRFEGHGYRIRGVAVYY